jgi:DNA-binding IclR family transcriptional regulator
VARAAQPAATTDNMARSSGLLQSLQRGIAVLTYVSERSTPPSTRQVADALGLDRTVTHRILQTLVAENMLEKIGNKFVPGPMSVVLANMYLDHAPIRRASLPYQIDFLHRGYPGMPWSLTVMLRVGAYVTDASRIWAPTAPLDSLLTIGPRVHLRNAAAGRCILAYLEPSEVAQLLGTDDAQALLPRLQQIRDAGGLDSVVDSERPGIPPGLAALSSVIRTKNGEPIAGLTLSGTELEEHLHRDSPVARHLARTAAEIGRAIA